MEAKGDSAQTGVVGDVVGQRDKVSMCWLGLNSISAVMLQSICN